MTRVVLTTSMIILACDALAFGGDTERVSLTSTGNEGTDHSALGGVAISANGRFVAFDSLFAFDPDPNKPKGVFLHDRLTSETRLVSLSSGGLGLEGQYPAISDDGTVVAFEAFDSESLHTQVLVHNLATGLTLIASAGASGPGIGSSHRPSLSGDGRYTAFASDAPNLVPGDTNGGADVFVFDAQTNTVTRASVSTGGTQADNISEDAHLSRSGQFVAFTSLADNLVANDNNHASDVFVRDLTNHITYRVSTASNGEEGNRESSFPSFAYTGQIAFQSEATNFVPGDSDGWDVYVKTLGDGSIVKASVNSSGEHGNGASCLPAISRDGTHVAFASFASNLTPDDQNGVADVFVRDLVQGVTFRVSTATGGGEADVDSGLLGIAISENGCVVAFQSDATNLVGDDLNQKSDAFVNDACAAAWRNYGSGWPGTNGVPSFVGSGEPGLCSSFTLTLGNSLGAPTVGTLLVGWRDSSVPTHWGGTMLVLPSFGVTVGVPAGGMALPTTIPCDPALLGMHAFTQAIEMDAGASNGVAFTPGMELVLGY